MKSSGLTICINFAQDAPNNILLHEGVRWIVYMRSCAGDDINEALYNFASMLRRKFEPKKDD